MPMQLTRVDTIKLKTALTKAEKKIDEAIAEVLSHTTLLTDDERAKVPRGRDGFPAAGRKLAQEIKARPRLLNAVEGFDPDAVIEDLDNVAALDPLMTKVAKLTQRLNDSKLAWTGEAWQPSLDLYGIAKPASKKDAELAKIIEGMTKIFSKSNPKPKKTKTEKAAAKLEKQREKQIAKAQKVLEKKGTK